MNDAVPAPGPSLDHTFQVDLRGLVDLLSHHLYSSPRVYLRELLQNGVDAVTGGFFRVAFAVPVLFVIWWTRRDRDHRPLRHRVIALAAGIAFGLDVTAWHTSIHYIGTGLATLLANTQVTGDLIGRDAILAVHGHPDGREPFVQPDGGILQDRADLHGELLFAAFALPQTARRDKRVLSGVAAGAGRLAIRPAEVNQKLKRPIRVSEVNDCLLEGCGELGGHD